MLKGRDRALGSAACVIAFGAAGLACQPGPVSSPLRIGFCAPPLSPDPHRATGGS